MDVGTAVYRRHIVGGEAWRFFVVVRRYAEGRERVAEDHAKVDVDRIIRERSAAERIAGRRAMTTGLHAEVGCDGRIPAGCPGGVFVAVAPLPPQLATPRKSAETATAVVMVVFIS